MMAFLRAHGFDAGPLQRPLLAGTLTGLVASLPAIAVLMIFPSFEVIADQVIGLSWALTAAIVIGSFAFSGLLYALIFRRAANDRRGGWLFGAGFGFLLWMAAPLVVLPVISGRIMAAGLAATGLFASFLVWGTVVGWLFPYIHHPLQRQLSSVPESGRSLGPVAAILRKGLIRRIRES